MPARAQLPPENEGKAMHFFNREQAVYQILKQMIFNYDLVPGQKLVYQDLADRFQVSRTPVKSALTMLEHEGFVRLYPNKGYYVAELSRQDAEELFDLREILETAAVERAIKNFSPEAFQELLRRKAAYEASVEEELTRQRFLIDCDFHLGIAMMAGNPALSRHLKEVLELIFLKHRVEGLSRKRGLLVKQEHEEICQRIKMGDTEGAVAAVRFHICQHKKNILSIL